jgi:cyanate lyase
MSELPSYCHSLLAAKAATALTFDDIAKAIGKPEVWTTALFFGQARCDEETAKKVTEVLKMASGEESVVSGLAGKGDGSFGVSGMVVRGGTWDGPPKVRSFLLCSYESREISPDEQDPVLYRLYEVLVVYGWSYKALIQEKVSPAPALMIRADISSETVSCQLSISELPSLGNQTLREIG